VRDVVERMRTAGASLVGCDETTKEPNMEVSILKFSGTHDAEKQPVSP